MAIRSIYYILFLSLISIDVVIFGVDAFVVSQSRSTSFCSSSHQRTDTPAWISASTRLQASDEKQSQKQTVLLEDEEGPAGIGGAEFFGGSKEKEEFYDETAELKAKELFIPEAKGTFCRFDNREAFETERISTIAKSLQSQFNAVLFEGATTPNTEYTYTQTKLDWYTPLSVAAATPLEEIEINALKFYKNIALSIVSGQEGAQENQVELQWELSVVWPTIWEPKALIMGSSTLTLDSDNKIVSQLDKVIDNSGDFVGTLANQITPRFWDLYHIGMTPSAELQPKVNLQQPSWFGNYETYEIPARWMMLPTLLETGSREDGNAQIIPNHAFTCVVTTMGPNRQRYVPTTPVEVQLLPNKGSNSDQLQLQWKIPLSVEFQTNFEWPLPGEDDEAVPGSEPECEYIYQPRRKVATVKYGGEAQDKEVTDIRKKLYEQVLKDGFKPKLDDNGRPIFFFLQNKVKACYTNEGLGMCVYEWRPELANSNEVGIELEVIESKIQIA